MPAAYREETLLAVLPIVTRPNPRLLSSGTYYLAEISGKLIGCGGWSFERPGVGNIEDRLAHIRHFAVHPDHTGQGVGRVLLQRCIQQAGANRVERLECYSTLNAEAFYAASGFKTMRFENVVLAGGANIPSILMERAI